MLHTVLSKKKVVLDQLRKGLQMLNVLDEITKRPSLFESLFLSNPNADDVTAEKVISSLRFSITEPSATRDYLLQYINDCSKQGMHHINNSYFVNNKVTQEVCFNNRLVQRVSSMVKVMFLPSFVYLVLFYWKWQDPHNTWSKNIL